MRIAPNTSGFARLQFDEAEQTILSRVISDTIALLDSRSGDDDTDPLAKLVGINDSDRPTDPALLRLLPDANPEDPEASAEFRRYTENDIREGKIANLRTMLFNLSQTSPVIIGKDEAHAWMVGLGDMRLIITSRLGVVTEKDLQDLYDAEDELEDSRSALLSMYDFLSWMQESFTQLFLKKLDEDS